MELKSEHTPDRQRTSSQAVKEEVGVVGKVYSQMKSLENKYLDLANFYKSHGSASEEQQMINDLLKQKQDLEQDFTNLKLAFTPQPPTS